MFESLKAAHRQAAGFASIATKWAEATRLDPGDRGQIVRLASRLVEQDDMEPEDAWVVALCGWISRMPWPESRAHLAVAMRLFLDERADEIGLMPETKDFGYSTCVAVLDNPAAT